MQFISAFVSFGISVGYAFPSYLQPVIDGSKFAFLRAPYVNTIKLQKDSAVEEDVSSRWPKGIVRYYVDKESYDDTFENVLRSPIHVIQSSSCIGFTSMNEKPSDNATWIYITNPRKERECNHVPRLKDTGEIELVFGYDCLKLNELLHTLLHGIGIRDEVTHPYRDKYIRILWDNIHPEYQHLYRKQTEKSFKTLVEYDPLSVMHFHDRAFSRNGHATIAPLEPGLLISPSDTLSQLDKMRLHMYFAHECNKRKVSNLLNTCKKTYVGADSGQANEKEEQDADNDNINEANGTEAKSEGAESKENASGQIEAINDDPNSKENASNQDSKINVEVEEIDVDKNGTEADKVKTNYEDIEYSDEAQNDSTQKKERESSNENVKQEEKKGGHDKNKNEYEDSANNEGDLENDNMPINGTSGENDLKLTYNQMISDRDSDENAVKSYEKHKFLNQHSSDIDSETGNWK